MISRVDVLATQLEHLANAQRAPGAEQHESAKALGHGLDDHLELFDGRRLDLPDPGSVRRSPDAAGGCFRSPCRRPPCIHDCLEQRVTASTHRRPVAGSRDHQVRTTLGVMVSMGIRPSAGSR